MRQTNGITDYVEHSFCYEFVSGKRFVTLNQNMNISITCLQFRKNQDSFMKPPPFPYLELQHIVCPPPSFCLLWIVVCSNGRLHSVKMAVLSLQIKKILFKSYKSKNIRPSTSLGRFCLQNPFCTAWMQTWYKMLWFNLTKVFFYLKYILKTCGTTACQRIQLV
jgi:hypothetical protein